MAAGATSSIGRPRLAAISSGRFRLLSAATVACTTLIGLDEPSDRDSTSWMPAHSSTARTGPPAMTPVPGLAGLSSTTPAASSPCTVCGIVLAILGTRKKCFLASSTPLAIAAGTSFALPYPTPTIPLPSPTTTRAVKLKRRPPLTTLATRLMVTTCSRYAACFSAAPPRRSSRRSRRSPPPPPRRGAPGISPSSSLYCRARSQLQAAFPGAVREGRDPAVVAVPAPVEHDGLDAGLLGPLREQLAHLARLAGLAAVGRADRRVQGGRGGQRAAHAVVDDLREHVLRGPVDDQPGPGRAAGDLLADPQVPAGAPGGGGLRLRTHLAGGASARRRSSASHDYLPAFPTLRRICSPWYRTPLPLYGSGLRSLRICAATSPTCCLSMPSTTNLVGASTRKVMPSGGVMVTGWLKPSENSRLLPLACTR